MHIAACYFPPSLSDKDVRTELEALPPSCAVFLGDERRQSAPRFNIKHLVHPYTYDPGEVRESRPDCTVSTLLKGYPTPAAIEQMRRRGHRGQVGGAASCVADHHP
jgi:hypothetical protein